MVGIAMIHRQRQGMDVTHDVDKEMHDMKVRSAKPNQDAGCFGAVEFSELFKSALYASCEQHLGSVHIRSLGACDYGGLRWLFSCI